MVPSIDKGSSEKGPPNEGVPPSEGVPQTMYQEEHPVLEIVVDEAVMQVCD